MQTLLVGSRCTQIISAIFGLVSLATPVWAQDSLYMTLPDHVANSCALAETLYQLETVELWGQPQTGGGDHLIASYDVRGLQGQTYAIPSPGPGNWYVMAFNPKGPSCVIESSRITLLPTDPTGVPVYDFNDPIISWRLYDVRGRLVRESTRKASGIYYRRGVTKKGRVIQGSPVFIVH